MAVGSEGGFLFLLGTTGKGSIHGLCVRERKRKITTVLPTKKGFIVLE